MLKAEEGMLQDSNRTADHQSVFLQVPAMAKSGVLYVDCLHDGRLSCSKVSSVVPGISVHVGDCRASSRAGCNAWHLLHAVQAKKLKRHAC